MSCSLVCVTPLPAYAAVFVANVGGISTNPLLSEKHIALICHAIATLWCIWVSLVVERLRLSVPSLTTIHLIYPQPP